MSEYEYTDGEGLYCPTCGSLVHPSEAHVTVDGLPGCHRLVVYAGVRDGKPIVLHAEFLQ